MSEERYTQEEVDQLIEEAVEAATEDLYTQDDLDHAKDEAEEYGRERGYEEGLDKVCEYPEEFLDTIRMQYIPIEAYLDGHGILDINDALYALRDSINYDIPYDYKENAVAYMLYMLDKLEAS